MLEEHQGGLPGRPGPEGVGADVRGRCSQTHPLQPLQGFRGPLRWSGLRLAVYVLGVLGGLGITPPGTHPVPIPTPVHPATCSAHYTYTVLGTAVLRTL